MSTLAENMVKLREYIANPPGDGWHLYNNWGDRVRPIPPGELNEKIFEQIADELNLGHQAREYLLEFAKEVGTHLTIEHIFEEGSPLGIAVLIMKFGIWPFKWMAFQGFFAVDPPDFNHFEPDHDTDQYVEYLLWSWKYGVWKYKCFRKG
jgi:hypothetical protein